MVDYDSFALSERRVLRKIDAVPQSTSVQDIDQLFDALPGLDGEQKEIIIDAIESSALSSESADQQAVNVLFDILENHKKERARVAQSLRVIASEKPDLLSENVQPLYGLLEQDPKAAVPATEALQSVLIAHPELGVQSAEMLIDIVDSVPREEKPDTVDHLLKVSDRDIVAEAVTMIANRLESDQAEQRVTAARNLGWIGSAEPDMVRDYTEKLVWKIDDEDTAVRKAALLAIQEIVEANPEFSDWNLDAVLNCLFDDNPDVRRITLELCEVVASNNPKRLEDHLASIITRIDPSGEPVDGVRQAAAHTLQEISEARPETLATDNILDHLMKCYDHTDIDAVRAPVIKFLTFYIEIKPVSLEFNLKSIESLLTDDSPPIKVQGWRLLPRLVRNTEYSIEPATVSELFPRSECSKDVRIAAVEAVRKLLSDSAIQSTPSLVDELICTTTESDDEVTKSALNVADKFPSPNDASPAESRPHALNTLAHHVSAPSPVGTSASRIVTRFAKRDPELVATSERIDALVTGLAERATDDCPEAIQGLATIGMEQPQNLTDEATAVLTEGLPDQISVLLEDGSAELQKASAQLLAQMASVGVELPEGIVDKLADVNKYDSTDVQRAVVNSLETIAQDKPSALINRSDTIAALFTDICRHDDSIIRVRGLRVVKALVDEYPSILLKSESELRPVIVEAVTHDHTETSITGMLAVIELADDNINLLLESDIWDEIVASLQADAAIMRVIACGCLRTVISETTDVEQLPEEALSIVPDLLSDSDSRVRREAHRIITELGKDYGALRGEEYAALGIERHELISLIFDSLDDEDAEVRAEAVLSIRKVERSDAYVIGTVPSLVDRLSDPDQTVRKRAMSSLRTLARTEPDRFGRAVEKIVKIHVTGFEDSQRLARELLAMVSDHEPGLVEPFLDSLIGTTGVGPERGGPEVLETFQHLGANSPEALTNRGLLTDFRNEALSHPDPETRKESARVLGVVASAGFQYVKHEVDVLLDRLDESDESEMIRRTAVALRIVASDVTEVSERIINCGGIEVLQDYVESYLDDRRYDKKSINEIIRALGEIGKPREGLYETLIRSLHSSLLRQESAKAIAAIAAEEPEWVASRNVIKEFEQAQQESRYSVYPSFFSSLSMLGENCSETTDVGHVVDLLLDEIGAGGVEEPRAAANGLNSLFSHYPAIVERPNVDTAGLAAELDPELDHSQLKNITSAIEVISKGHPDQIVDTPIVPKLINALEEMEGFSLVNVTDAVGFLGRTHPESVREAVKPLIANADKYRNSSMMIAARLHIASLRALARISEGSPEVVADRGDQIISHLSASLDSARAYAGVMILQFDSDPNVDVEEKLINESLDTLKEISELSADERDRVIELLAVLSEQNSTQLVPIREELDSISQSVDGEAAQHIDQILERVPRSSS